jgi:hypothetical protein
VKFLSSPHGNKSNRSNTHAVWQADVKLLVRARAGLPCCKQR